MENGRERPYRKQAWHRSGPANLWRRRRDAAVEAAGWRKVAARRRPNSGALLQQILGLRLTPRVGNATGTTCPAALCHFSEMWYGVFLWALVSSLTFHIPAGLLALFTLRRHRYGRFMPVSIFLMGLVGPLAAGTLTSAAIAGVYRAAGKEMIPFEALTLGVGQTFCVVMISFLRILATL
ncbi:transmembrane protein 170A [Python bivittatus]|uniref:Transmembrane protein 170A n=1 Tax=Python bivittatus TaxID=176946 RepID=A0A9F5IRN7_PYTBI|nr:transmembrane protein 170A [Python bivittatus]